MLKNTNKELAIAVALLLKENSENRYKVIIESSGNILLKLTSNNWNFHAQSIFRTVQRLYPQIIKMDNYGGSRRFFLMSDDDIELNSGLL